MFLALLTVDQFKKCASAKGHTPTDAIAHAFIDQAEKFGGINSKREAYMAIAQMAWESDGFRAKSEYACSNGHWNSRCASYDKKGCPAGKNYYGRGFIQLTHCYNYKAAANAIGDQRIVNDPDIVARDDRLAMATALWYWKSRVHSYVTNGHFGAATKHINGGECHGAASAAHQRWHVFKSCLQKVS